ILTIDVDNVVVFRALHELPVVSEPVRPQAARETGHVERAVVRCACLADDAADGDSKAVCQRRIESCALWRRLHDVGVHIPVLRLVESAWTMRSDCGGE